MTFKIFHIADIHADGIFMDDLHMSLEAFTNKLIETYSEEQQILIVVAGDVFNKRSIALEDRPCREIMQWISIISGYAPVAIVGGTPSHEGIASMNLEFIGSYYNVITSIMPENLVFCDGRLSRFSDDDPLTDLSAPNTVLLSMVPTPTKQFLQGSDDDISAAITPLFAGFGALAKMHTCPHILVGHFSVRGSALYHGQTMIGRDIEIGVDQIRLAWPDLVCLGHIHKAQMVRDNIFYSGSLFPTKSDEIGDHGFYIHTILDEAPKRTLDPSFSRHTVISEFVKVPHKKLYPVKDDLTAHNFEPDIENEEDLKDATVRVDLKMYQDELSLLDKESIEKMYLEKGAKEVIINVSPIPRDNPRSEKILILTQLPDKIQEHARVKDEAIPDGVLDIAHDFEILPEEEIYEKVQRGDYEGSGSGLSANGGNLRVLPTLGIQTEQS